jgi:hypothetical protein
MTYARTGNYEVRLASGLKCRCGWDLRPTDVEVDFGEVRWICSGCHRDVLIIGAAS